MTNRNTWKAFERAVANDFNTKRQPLSGGMGRDDQTRSDTTHDKLFIECKYRERHSVRTLYDDTKELAKREQKTPVLCLKDKGRPGYLIVVHSDDLDDFLKTCQESK